MTTTTLPRPVSTEPHAGAQLRTPMMVSSALAVATAVGAAGTLFLDGVLRGTAVMNGSARGTALVMLVVALPTMLAGMVWTYRGSIRAVFAWLGAIGYLAYNTLMLLLASPFNRLFLVYVAMLALSLAGLATLVAALDTRALATRLAAAPARLLAGYLWLIVALNTLAWLRNIVPALGTQDTPDFLAGSGLTTNPLYVFDLAVWLPLAAVSGFWLWRRRPAGHLVGGGMLVLWFIESIGVTTDQWFGWNADPNTELATLGGMYLFAGLSALAIVPLLLFLRRVEPSGPAPSADVPPGTAGR